MRLMGLQSSLALNDGPYDTTVHLSNPKSHPPHEYKCVQLESQLLVQGQYKYYARGGPNSGPAWIIGTFV